jgi:hypothetical protein
MNPESLHPLVMKRDGTAGKPIPEKIWARVEKEIWGMCGVIEQVSDQLAYERYEEKEMEQLQ